MGKEELKKIADSIIGVSTKVEATLDSNEFYIYTEVWTLTIEQLDRIRKEVNITTISVEGYSIMLTAKV